MTSTSSVGVCHTPSDRLQEYIVELKVDALHAAVEKRMLAVDPRASVITRAGGWLAVDVSDDDLFRATFVGDEDVEAIERDSEERWFS